MIHRHVSSQNVSTQTPVVVLLGPPNVGKSTLFTVLTGVHQHVGNWPGKTVSYREGWVQVDGIRLTIVDLPGTYGFSHLSEEEHITWEYLLTVRPHVVVVVANATAPEYGLYLLAEGLSLGLPAVLALTMMDEARKQGIQVDIPALEAFLGVPVVPVAATRREGVNQLLHTILAMMQGHRTLHPRPPALPEGLIEPLARLQGLLASCPDLPFPHDWTALKLLEGDTVLEERLRQTCPQVYREVEPLLVAHREAFLDVISARYAWVNRALQVGFYFPQTARETFTDRLDRVLTHPYWGLPILLAVLAGVYMLTYRLALPVADWLEGTLLAGAAAWLHSSLASAVPWFRAFVVEGLLSGVGLVLSFLPILVIFFTVLAFLEAVGYMARVAYVMHRFMQHIGLQGRSFLPLFLGFGCNVPAVLGARIAHSRGARILTVLLAPFMPCTARMAVVTFLAPAFFGAQAALVVWGLVALNLLLMVGAGIGLRAWLFPYETTGFIMEMPPYRWPDLPVVGTFVWRNTQEFLSKAGTVILAVSASVWALSFFPGGDVQHSYLARLGPYLLPLGQMLGWQDWRLPVALLTGFVAKENTIATLGVLYGLESGTTLAQRIAKSLSPAAGLSFLVVQMLFIPCAATISAIRQEIGLRWAVFSVALMLVVSLLAGMATFHIVRFIGG